MGVLFSFSRSKERMLPDVNFQRRCIGVEQDILIFYFALYICCYLCVKFRGIFAL